MKKLVCEKFCSFFDPEKETMKCGSLAFLERNLTYGEIRLAAKGAPKKFDLSTDGQIKSLVCENGCKFFTAKDCDFRLGHDSPPCGGYAIVERLLKVAQPFSPPII
jgi:hypothetical protein